MGDNIMKKILTLCIVHQHPKILLGMKKRGFGAGRWNGFGGKVEANETIEAAAKRELEEEAGVRAKNMQRTGIIEFEFVGNPEILEVHVFTCSHIEGEPHESDEMRPQWFDSAEIPYQAMWADDKHWLPLALAGKRFYGKFLFDGEKSNTIIEYNLSILPHEK
jgi:8-oxo-dGTP diphosphatase/2-hydroxy-dATP diphosphatase